jgi:hypothetical protein
MVRTFRGLQEVKRAGEVVRLYLAKRTAGGGVYTSARNNEPPTTSRRKVDDDGCKRSGYDRIAREMDKFRDFP